MTKRDDQAMEYAAEHSIESDRPVCRTCYFYVSLGNGTGECHRYPPSPARMSGAVGEHAVTQEDNACGEYRSRNTALWVVPPQLERRDA